MYPTAGRIVMYKTTQLDRDGFRVLYGNQSRELPAIILAVHSATCLNLKVFGDAQIDLWKTSISEGIGEGNWSWPKKEE